MKPVFDNKYGRKLRGVNLGGWLLLEKWMTPSLFEGLEAKTRPPCAWNWARTRRISAEKPLEYFITREDFAWLARLGINAVRIPVGHWITGPISLSPRLWRSLHPFVEGGLEILDRAFDWAEEYGLRSCSICMPPPAARTALITAASRTSANGIPSRSISIILCTYWSGLAERYHNRPALHAIEVLNEPRWDINTALLKQYTAEGYRRIRQYCQARRCRRGFP